jgi:Methyltransferase FkbM domain
MYRSHQGQDRWVIESVFPEKHGGWFIDAGAGPDGIRGSNSYLLETEFGWKGLLVEPHPECYKSIKASRSVVVEECCLADSRCEVEFVLNEHPELSSIPQHLSEPNFVAAGYARKQFTKVRVPGVPQWELLRRHHAPATIEYMSLDIEGAEWIALRDFPFDEFLILCMTVERGGKSYGKLRVKLRREGYRLVRAVIPDDFYVHESLNYHTTLAERFDTQINSIWHTVYFNEPMLSVRRSARWVRRLLHGY